jgi:hypothetical protein
MNVRVKEASEELGRVQIRDWSLWTKHVSGAAALVSVLEGLAEDEVIELLVDGVRGEWVKKKNGSGAPTPGLKPLGPMREQWFDWYKERRGELASIALGAAPATARRPSPGRSGETAALQSATPAEADAAWAAFEGLSQAGWRWEGPRESQRVALHDRDSL